MSFTVITIVVGTFGKVSKELEMKVEDLEISRRIEMIKITAL